MIFGISTMLILAITIFIGPLLYYRRLIKILKRNGRYERVKEFKKWKSTHDYEKLMEEYYKSETDNDLKGIKEFKEKREKILNIINIAKRISTISAIVLTIFIGIIYILKKM